MEKHFGPHITLDLKGCPVEVLQNYQLHFDYLNRLPEQIGMHKIIPPYCFPYEGLVPEDKGITGVVIIAESHITVHSFELKGYTFVDIFSCKPFDIEAAIQYTIEQFRPQRYDVRTTQRGLDFPR